MTRSNLSHITQKSFETTPKQKKGGDCGRYLNAPASIIAAISLWKLKRYGYAVSQFVAGFYIYASVEIFVDVAQAGPPYLMEIIFPQILAVIVAIFLIFYSGV